MATWKDRIIELLSSSPGLSDREITDRLAGPGKPQQNVNRICRELEREGWLARRRTPEGLIGNFPEGPRRAASAIGMMPDEVTVAPLAPHPTPTLPDSDVTSEVTVELIASEVAPVSADAEIKPSEDILELDATARPDGGTIAPPNPERISVPRDINAGHLSPGAKVHEVRTAPSAAPERKTSVFVSRIVDRLRAVTRLITQRQ